MNVNYRHSCFPDGSALKNLPANARATRDVGLSPGSRKIPWRKKWQPTPVLLPGESHGQRSLAGYSPWGRKESDMDEHCAHMHTCSCIDIIGA